MKRSQPQSFNGFSTWVEKIEHLGNFDPGCFRLVKGRFKNIDVNKPVPSTDQIM